MKIKHILLGLVFATSAINAKNKQQTREQHQAHNTVQVTAHDALWMFRYFKNTYCPLIKALREGYHVSRTDIINAFDNDTFLTRLHGGGHALFKHKILPLTLGVIAHGNSDIVGPNERKQHHKSLQVYVNVVKLFIQDVVNPREALTALATMSEQEWKHAYGALLEQAAQRINQATAAEWAERIKTEEAKFDEYSRN